MDLPVPCLAGRPSLRSRFWSGRSDAMSYNITSWAYTTHPPSRASVSALRRPPPSHPVPSAIPVQMTPHILAWGRLSPSPSSPSGSLHLQQAEQATLPNSQGRDALNDAWISRTRPEKPRHKERSTRQSIPWHRVLLQPPSVRDLRRPACATGVVGGRQQGHRLSSNPRIPSMSPIKSPRLQLLRPLISRVRGGSRS
ncbi:hypothetical protein CSOJ01_02089 [Colletotrichum sojae]|uniref:Uncharacterized protein n=1 Tax=Colletotrichum sojae TaxID=2175907 RepID=A0A8H6N2I6_9PEZI|nr:hypothetical protein CSOJ01_02089 [Colletotrichum sojae]